jgi:hypothetical protein
MTFHSQGVCEHGAERIFDPKERKVTGLWERVHNEVFHSLYYSANIIESKEGWGGGVQRTSGYSFGPINASKKTAWCGWQEIRGM